MLENGSSVYQRIVRNLQILEQRNPDLAFLLQVADQWLEKWASGTPTEAEKTVADTATGAKVPEPVVEISAAPAAAPVVEPVSEEAASPEKKAVSEGDAASSVPEPTVERVLADPVRREVPNAGLLNPVETEQLEKRLLLKIEASRWALERDKLLKSNCDFQTEIEPKDHALLARARELTNCYLWMNNPETAPVVATDTYELLAEAYASAAGCVAFMRKLIDLVDRSPRSEVLSRILRDALYVTATAQSALRRVTYEVSGREDQDQIRIHRWLTLLTKKYSIYVNRHMKKNSLAPIEKIYLIPDYITRLEEEVAKLGQKQKILAEGFRRIQYHSSRINENSADDYDWNRIINTVDELVDAGTRASDSRFRELLTPILPYLKNVPSYKEHPFFINVLLELDFWKGDEKQLAKIQEELSLTPPRPSINPEGSGLSPSLWEDGDEESPMEKTSEKGVSNTASTPGGFGFGILPENREAAPTPTHAAPPKVPFRMPFGRPMPGPAPSYAGVVEQSSHVPAMGAVSGDSRTEAEIFEEVRKRVGTRVVLLVDGTGESELKEQLESQIQVKMAFVGPNVLQSEPLLAQQQHPGNVAVVLMVDGSVPTSNRNVENYCRRFDKPLLRVARTASALSVGKQIQAALNLYS
ncbi:MAG: hypothetical protein Q4D98_10360 [Planctomycetia bacterium]|nr:hypothetical protein [Planctomycetia bacterium]